MFAFETVSIKRISMKAIAVGSAVAMLLALAAPAAPASTTAGFRAATSVDGEASTDWSGWDVTDRNYTSVSAAWTVPTVTCGTSEDSYSADWVGLDGDGSNSVEQIGTSSDCDSGTPTYSAWFEFYPSVAVTTSDTVGAGDKMAASVVAIAGTDKFTLTLTDTTRSWTKTETAESPGGSGASAEIIAEAPSGSERVNSVLPLADFKTVTFSDVLVNGKKIGDVADAQKIAMVDGNGSPMAIVTALSAGDTFTVTWVSSGYSGDAQQAGVDGSGGQSSVGSGWPQGGFGSGGYGSGGSGSGAWGYSGGWGDSFGYGYGGGSADGDGYGATVTSGFADGLWQS